MSTVLSATEEMLKPMLEKADELRGSVAEIDKELGTDKSGPTKILDAAADTVAEQFTAVAQQVVDVVNGEHGDSRVAVIALLRRALREFDPEVKAYVDSNTPEDSGPAVPLEVVQAKREERKQIVDAYNSMRTVILNFGGDPNSVPEIKNLRGAIGGTGTRGMRINGTWSFEVDGTLIAGNKLSDVQKATGATGATDVREAVKVAHPTFFDSKEAQEAFNRIEFKVNGKNVVGTRSGSDVDEDSDDEVVSDPSNEDIFGSDDDR